MRSSTPRAFVSSGQAFNARLKVDFTKDQILSLLEYDPSNGTFVWRLRSPDSHGNRTFNSKFAGKSAGSLDRAGYVTIKLGDKHYRAHRLVWLVETGEWPAQQIDHIDGKKSRNIFSNLRLATHSQNQMNSGVSRANSSGYRGVRWHKKSGKWVATIRVLGEDKYLGLFAEKADAIAARREATLSYFGSFGEGVSL